MTLPSSFGISGVFPANPGNAGNRAISGPCRMRVFMLFAKKAEDLALVRAFRAETPLFMPFPKRAGKGKLAYTTISGPLQNKAFRNTLRDSQHEKLGTAHTLAFSRVFMLDFAHSRVFHAFSCGIGDASPGGENKAKSRIRPNFLQLFSSMIPRGYGQAGAACPYM